MYGPGPQCRRGVEVTIIRWGSQARGAEILRGRTRHAHCRAMLENIARQQAKTRNRPLADKRPLSENFGNSRKFGGDASRPPETNSIHSMKHPSPLLLAHVFLVTVSLTPLLAGAQSKDTYWTSVEGVTIWARLTGWEGTNVILVKSGRTYRVPFGRLTPESMAKAHRLLALSSRPVTPLVEKVPEGHEPPDLPAPDLPGDDPVTSDAADGPVPGLLLPPPIRIEPATEDSSSIRLENRQAIVLSEVPSIIRMAVAAGNRLQDKSYKWGGGRARLEDNGYDCSGSVSYVLIKAGLMRSPLTSGGFTRYGSPGPGRWITIYARNGHVFMTVCGLRLDTGGHGGRGESGPRWCPNFRSTIGFVIRHPVGF